MRPAKFLLSLLLAIASSPIVVFPQSTPPSQTQDKIDPFIREHNDRRAKNPEGLSFTVRLKDNRTQFQLGEIITLELGFAAAKPETFTLDAATYDRSGRLHSDGFVIDQRDAAVDPLADYFYSGLHAFMMGGLRGIPDLTDKPYVITADLNEWRRIDKPGHYRMYVTSGRVGTKDDKRRVWNTDVRAVVSNVVEFDVLPANAKWSRQKLNEAVAALAKPDGDRDAACRTLRFLGTTAAVPELIKRFRGDDRNCEWDYKFGLIGSPHRDLVIREMENAISLREQPVTTHFINTLALMEFSKRAGPEPQYVDQVSWEAQFKRRHAIYDQLRLDHLRQLLIAIPQKQGKARATSLQALLDSKSDLNNGDFPQWTTLLASMAEVFTHLSLDDQLRALQYQWKLIASPAMVPVLREVLKYSFPKGPKQTEIFNEFHQQDLRSIAVRRLYELAPDEGRRLIIEEIRRRKIGLDQDVLRSLPDETLPELNSVLLTNLEEAHRTGGIDGQSELIERYATDAILARVRTVYESRDAGNWDCRTQAALLAYFLRVSPAIGREYLDKALAARDKHYPNCYAEMLKSVAALHMSPEIEEAATAALDDEEAAVVANAAAVLGDYGSADAEKALWRRFEKWHEEMKSRKPEAGTEQKLNSDDEKIETAFREALARGHAWLSDPEKLKRVRELCLTETSRKEIDEMISGWGYEIYVARNPSDEDSPKFVIAQYGLKSLDSLSKKLLQFPKGSAFRFKIAADGVDETRSEQLFQQIKKHLEEHGMTLERAPAPEK